MRKPIVAGICLLLTLSLFGCAGPSTNDPDDDKLTPETLAFESGVQESKINWYGRCYYDAAKSLVSINNASSGFEVSFYGSSLKAEIVATESKQRAPELSGNGYLAVFIDGEDDYREAPVIELSDVSGNAAEVILCEGLEKGNHTVKVLKITEVKYTEAYVKSITADGGFREPPAKPSLKFEIIGDSITAGANAMRKNVIDETGTSSENSLASYGAVAAMRLGAQFQVVCRSGVTVSGGNSGSSYPKIADYYGKYSEKDAADWDFTQYIPDVVILDLGTNDKILRLSDAVIRAAYKSFVDEVRSKYPNAYILCCTGAMGDAGENDISAQLGTLVDEIAAEYAAQGDEKIMHIALVQKSTGGHPLAQAHRTNGMQLVGRLKAILGLDE